MSSPNFGDYLVAGAGGAALGFLDNQQKVNDEAKVKLEQERQVKLLMLKEKLTAAREERKAGIEHGYKMNELGAKQKFDADEKSKDRAAKIIEEGTKEELERWKVGKQSETSLSVANINAESRKLSGRGRGELTEAQEVRLEDALGKIEAQGIDETNVAQANRIASRLGLPLYEKVLVKPAEKGGMFSSDKPAVYEFRQVGGTEEDIDADGNGGAGESKLDSIFNEYGASRTKKGPNDGKQPMPAATGAPGDVVEPQPISVGAGDKVTSAAPVSGSGYAQAASGPPPVDELPMKQVSAPSRAAELKAPLDVGKSWAEPEEKDNSFLQDIVAAILEFGGRNATGGKNEIIAQLREKYPHMTDKMLELEYQKVIEQMRGKNGKFRFNVPE